MCLSKYIRFLYRKNINMYRWHISSTYFIKIAMLNEISHHPTHMGHHLVANNSNDNSIYLFFIFFNFFVKILLKYPKSIV